MNFVCPAIIPMTSAYFVVTACFSLLRQSAPDGPQEYLRPACRVVEGVSYGVARVVSKGAYFRPSNSDLKYHNRALLTVLGLSGGCTRLPSNKKWTELGALPCLSQKASINFLRIVVRLILKKTSLLLSVTFDAQMFANGLTFRLFGTWPSVFDRCRHRG
jgi:hypothetical protein